MIGPREALQRLADAAARGDLASLCERYEVVLLVAFGGALRSDGSPRDLDIAVRFVGDNQDVLGFLDALSEVAGTSALDLMDLDRAGPVAKERALVGGRLLVQAQNGLFSRAQLAAMMERMDTDWLRRIDLELLTG